MLVFRLSKKKFSSTLSGAGAAKAGGRWNSKGVGIIYTSDSRALSMLEKYIHLPSGILPKSYVMMTINIPDTISQKKIDIKALPSNWKNDAGILHTKAIGDNFVATNSDCILQVPSAVVPGDDNFLINPDHSDFSMIEIIESLDIPFDDRLFKK